MKHLVRYLAVEAIYQMAVARDPGYSRSLFLINNQNLLWLHL